MSGDSSTTSLRIAWIGFHQEGIPALQGLRDGGVPLVAVITLDEPAAAKRCATAEYSDVLNGWNVPLHRVRNINDDETIRLLSGMNLDLLLVIGWSQILSAAALATARIGAIGAHASLLPHNRGSAPVNWAIIRGEKTTGNTLIWLADNVDEGHIIDQIEFPISPYDTCETLYQKVAESNHVMMQRVLPKLLAGERPGRPQPHSDESLLPRRRPSDGLLDWHQSAVNVYNFIRALTRPYPGAFSFLDGRRWTIQSAALLPTVSQEHLVPGMVIGSAMSPVAEACGQLVACGSGYLIVLEIEADDGTVLKGSDLSDCDWTGKVWAHE
ncbi:MAG: methionyl-tRNA formyltransferase [Planctomycetaceae bacterium]